MPRLPKKSPCDDDPFWDNWDEEPIAKENRAPLRCTKTKKMMTTTTTTNAAPSCDPFGLDGFGDGWNYKPVAKFDCDDHDPVPQEDFSSAEFDWGPAAACARARRQAEEVKRNKEREEWLSVCIKKTSDAKAKAAEAKTKAEAKAETEAKEVAVKTWHHTVKQATDCIAHAEPAKALNILYSLSLNVEVAKHINPKEKGEVSQMYAALYDHFDLQKFLSSYFDRSSEIDESISDETTIGGDTIKVNRSHTDGEEERVETEGIMIDSETGNTVIVVVVDQFPTHPIGGDTVKCPSSHCQSTAEDEEESSSTRKKKACHGGSNSQKENNTNWNQAHYSHCESDRDKNLPSDR